jgi:hypothetical protein
MNHSRYTVPGLIALVVVLAAFLGLIGLNTLGGFQGVIQGLSPIAPTVAALAASFSAVAAAASLGVTAFSNYRGWNRQMTQATVEAWASFSENTQNAKKVINHHLGKDALSAEQAALLIEKKPFLTAKGPLTEEESLEMYKATVEYLNGFERLAVGVKRRVYDSQTLRDLAATIIVRQHKRFEHYIELRRETPLLDRRQSRAFINFSDLAAEFERHDLDRARIARMRA